MYVDFKIPCCSSHQMRNKQFVRILNHPGNHWITISTMDCNPGTVNVYDSMNLPLTNDLEVTVADLLCIPEQYIILKHVKMQYQIGASDCGLFAISSACNICNGENPAELKVDQNAFAHGIQQCNTHSIPFQTIEET